SESSDRLAGWTSDGRALLFRSDRASTLGIFKQSLSDVEPQPVVLGPADAWDPQIAPDQSSLLYLASSNDRRGSTIAPNRLMRLPASGGPAEPILETRHSSWVETQFRCSRRLEGPCVLSEEDGSRTVWTLFNSRGRQGELLRLDFPPRWKWDLSPDGSKLAFGPMSVPTAPTILTLASGTKQQVPVREPQALTEIVWSADGQGLFAATVPRPAASLLHLALDGRVHVLSTRSRALFETPRPSPDGRQLAFTELTVSRNAWVLEP